MKQRIACLLAALLLCLSGAANASGAYQLDITCALNEQETLTYLTGVAGNYADRQPRIKALVTGMAKLLNHMSFQLTTQDDGLTSKMVLCVQDKPLIDIVLGSVEGETASLCAFPALLPGVALKMDMTTPEAQLEQQSSEELTSTDWEAVASAVISELENWFSPLDDPQETGRFIGDIYEGGKLCATMTFDDRELSMLLNRLLNGIEGQLGRATIAFYGDSNRILGRLRQMSKNLAESNRYNYVLHHITDEKNSESSLSAYSLTMFEQGEQVMTLSFVMTDEDFRAVWGFGEDTGNRYFEVSFTPQSDTEASFTLSIYNDWAKQGFRSVKAGGESVLLLQAESRLVAEKMADENAQWTISTLLTQPAYHDLRLRCESKGSWLDSEETLRQSWKAYVNDSDEPCISFFMNMMPTDTIVLDWSGLKQMEKENEEAIAQAMDDMARGLSIELFKRIPPELLTFLMK